MASHDNTNDPQLAHRAAETEADEIRADELKRSSSASGTNEESGLEQDSEKLKADRLDQPASAAGTNHSPEATEATRIRSDEIEQDAAVTGVTNVDDGLAPESERIRSDRIDEPN